MKNAIFCTIVIILCGMPLYGADTVNSGSSANIFDPVGQNEDALIAKWGTPTSRMELGNTVELTFRDAKVSLTDGVVVEVKIENPPPEPSNKKQSTQNRNPPSPSTSQAPDTASLLGKTEGEAIKALGEQEGKCEFDNKVIVAYRTANVTLENGLITKVDLRDLAAEAQLRASQKEIEKRESDLQRAHDNRLKSEEKDKATKERKEHEWSAEWEKRQAQRQREYEERKIENAYESAKSALKQEIRRQDELAWKRAEERKARNGKKTQNWNDPRNRK